jgi:hypothetical protein
VNMAIDVIQYQKPQKEPEEDKSFLGQIAKPMALAGSAASIYGSLKSGPKIEPEKPQADSAIMRRMNSMNKYA